MPKAAVWQTRRQAKKSPDKKKKEKEAGEEGEGDDDDDADAEDGDGDGDRDWDGGDKGDGPGAVEGAAGADPDEGMGVEVAGLEGEGVVDDGSVVGEGEGEQVSRRRTSCPPRKRSSLGMYKDSNRMCPCRHPHLHCMFHSPFIHTLLFVWHACSGGVPVACSGGAPVVFRQKQLLKANVFRQQHGVQQI